MTGFRTVLAVLLVVTYPPGVLYWYLLHPFAKRWRRLGVGRSLTVLIGTLLVACYIGFLWRDRLLGADLGLSPPLATVGTLLWLVSMGIEVKCRRHLKLRTLVGVPEVAADGPGALLTGGIYGRIRHPRYVAVFLGTWGWTLFANFSGAYLVVAISSLLLLGVVWIEERELHDRFGPAWDRYAETVPRFIPRRSGTRP